MYKQINNNMQHITNKEEAKTFTKISMYLYL